MHFIFKNSIQFSSVHTYKYKLISFGSNILKAELLVKKKPQKQLTALEANQSRIVTKARWVVESTIGMTKKFAAVCDIANNAFDHLLNDIRISGALVNLFLRDQL